MKVYSLLLPPIVGPSGKFLVMENPGWNGKIKRVSWNADIAIFRSVGPSN